MVKIAASIAAITILAGNALAQGVYNEQFERSVTDVENLEARSEAVLSDYLAAREELEEQFGREITDNERREIFEALEEREPFFGSLLKTGLTQGIKHGVKHGVKHAAKHGKKALKKGKDNGNNNNDKNANMRRIAMKVVRFIPGQRSLLRSLPREFDDMEDLEMREFDDELEDVLARDFDEFDEVD